MNVPVIMHGMFKLSNEDLYTNKIDNSHYRLILKLGKGM